MVCRSMFVAALMACGPEPAVDGDTDTEPDADADTDADSDADTDPSLLTLGEERICFEPGLRFGAAWDIDTYEVPMASDLWIWGGGAIAVDLNCDVHVDVVMPSEFGASVLINDGVGGFEQDEAFFAPLDLTWGTGGSVADYDGDGDLDLFYTRYDEPNVLLRNDSCAWVDVSVEALPDVDVTFDSSVVPQRTVNARTGYKSMVSSWADMDHDGDLDLYVGNYGIVDETGTPTADFLPADPNLLLLNNGDGTFSNESDRLPVQVHDCYDYAGGFFDFTGDGWPDLYTVCDFGIAFPNAFITNVNGTLAYDPLSSNGLQGLDVTGMGLGIADLNDDDIPDILISEWNKMRLFQSSDDYWLQILDSNIEPNGLFDQKVAWGTELIDVDNDGDDDAPVAFGSVNNENPVWKNALHQPDAIFVNDGQQQFTDEAIALDYAQDGVSRGFAVADFNGDGWLDIVKRDLLGANTAHISRCGDAGWIDVELADTGSENTFGIGATIQVIADGEAQRRWMVAGGLNFASGGPPVAHFGVGTSSLVETLSVQWSDGTEQVFHDVPVRRRVTVEKP